MSAYAAIAEADYSPWMRELATRRSRRRPPKFLALDALPPLHDGRSALPEAVITGLIKRMAELGGEGEAPLLEALAAWALPESRGRFGLALMQAWWGAGKRARSRDWLLYGAGRLGGATWEGWLPAQLAELGSSRRRSDRELVRRILPALELQGDDEAARQILLLIRRGDSASGVELEAAAARLAERRGLSRAALEEALLPLEETLRSLSSPRSIPALIKLADMPPLRYRDGRELDSGLTGGIVRAMVSKSGGSNGLWRSVEGGLRELLDPASAEAFAGALLAAWEAEGFHGRYSWVMHGLRSFGGDATALALKPLLQSWSSRSASDTERLRAIAAMSIFEAIGTETALLVLVGLGARSTRPSVHERAQQVIRQAARQRGLSVGELEDHIVPDCGLDAGGSRIFDYGPRQLTLVFDEDFRPRVRAPDGRCTPGLPEPEAGDDPELVAAARADWGLISGQLAEILDVQTMRLQRAMIGGRRWEPAAWRRYLLEHPLMVNYARRLVWGIYGEGGELLGSFRVDEGGELLDGDDEPVAIAEGQRVGLVHPATLSAAERAAWGEVLADYEVITPFAQIERPVYTPAEDELEERALTRFAGLSVEARRLYDTLIGLQWDRDAYGGWRSEFYKLYREAGLFVTISIKPGYGAGGVEWAAPQSIPRVVFEDRARGHEPGTDGRLPLGAVDPVVFSEVLRDIYELAEGA